MVSVLSKYFGIQNFELVEDVVQQTFMDAMNAWKIKGIPDNPSAWLYRVAKNKAIDVLRRNRHSENFDFSSDDRILLTSEYTLTPMIESQWDDETIKDDMLRMMFACSHPAISVENQITLILKTLCGLSTKEIARAFLTTEDTISKRLYRTKETFRKENISVEFPKNEDLKLRIQGVLNSIYLLFNEGFNSNKQEERIRIDLVNDAMMLGKMLIENKHTQQPQTFSLMALMCFHASRMDSRIDKNGDIVLLQNQDRTLWDKGLIQEGNHFMNLAANGKEISNYHIEAAIVYEHCSAEKFEETNWKHILELYQWLCKISPSLITELNKIIAILEAEGANSALTILKGLAKKYPTENNLLYHTLLGEVYKRLDKRTKALKYFKIALKLVDSKAEEKLILGKINEL